MTKPTTKLTPDELLTHLHEALAGQAEPVAALAAAARRMEAAIRRSGLRRLEAAGG